MPCYQYFGLNVTDFQFDVKIYSIFVAVSHIISFHHHQRHKMNLKCGLLVLYLILKQSITCNGQLVTLFRKELNGLKNTYQNQGFIPSPNCTHEKRRPTFLTFKDVIKFTSCLKEIDEQGRMKRNQDQDKRAVIFFKLT